MVENLLNTLGLNTEAIADLDAKKAQVLNALKQTGIPSAELAAVTTLLLIEKTPLNASGLIVQPLDGNYVADELSSRQQCGIDRTVELNLAATALAGAAL